MKAEDCSYKGRPLDEYSRDELKDIIAEMGTFQQISQEHHEKQVGFLNECRRRK